MRVNVYAEELREVQDKYGPRVTLIHQKVVSAFKHSAIQILLGDRVPHTQRGKEIDDDTPAVKFWFADETHRQMLISIFEKALEELRRPEAHK